MANQAFPALARCDVEGRVLKLADGSCATVRALRAHETAIVAEVFAGMSERSRRDRFGGPKPQLSPAELEHLAAVDHRNHEALVAVESDTGRAVAIARFVRDRFDEHVAEVAFAVVDGCQGRRLGTRLAELLACRAREEGIERLRAFVLAENRNSRALVRRLGRLVDHSFDGDSVELVVALA